MDVVITYVDNKDKKWQDEFNKYNNKNIGSLAIDSVRFTPKDNLRYCLRSIAKNMPFVKKVHLVVSSPSQVPKWIDKEEVNIVYHSDIIPKEYLPTFNSRTIEMFLHNIKDLAEEFIYFNDDTFVINSCNYEDIFFNGKPNNNINNYTEEKLKHIWGRDSIYFYPHKRCNDEVKKILNIKDNNYYLTNHGPSPMLKSDNIELFEKLKDKISPTLGKFRSEKDYVHFIYSIYTFLKGNMNIDKPITNEYVNLSIVPLTSLYKIVYTNKTFICLNDIIEENYKKSNAIDITIKKIFTMLFPDTCKYEKKVKVSLCVIVKNENRYLKEFINHYLSLGFEKIYLYDNNDIDGENPLDIIKEFNTSKIVYNDYRGKKVCQKMAYNECYKKYGNECDWIAFFDADEFLDFSLTDNISSFISEFENSDYNCVFINWLCYNDNDKIYYEDKPLKERFTQKALNKSWFHNNIPLNFYVKSIIKTKINGITFIESVHHPNGNYVRACNTEKEPCLLANYHIPTYNKASLNHYITKSLEEWVNKIKRGYPDHIVNEDKYKKYIERYFIINKETKEKREIFNKLK